jgi:hypothetical protein
MWSKMLVNEDLSEALTKSNYGTDQLLLFVHTSVWLNCVHPQLERSEGEAALSERHQLQLRQLHQTFLHTHTYFCLTLLRAFPAGALGRGGSFEWEAPAAAPAASPGADSCRAAFKRPCARWVCGAGEQDSAASGDRSSQVFFCLTMLFSVLGFSCCRSRWSFLWNQGINFKSIRMQLLQVIPLNSMCV